MVGDTPRRATGACRRGLRAAVPGLSDGAPGRSAPACHAPADAVSVPSGGCVTASWLGFVRVSLAAYAVAHFGTLPGCSDVVCCEDTSLAHLSSGLSVLCLLICRRTLYILGAGPVPRGSQGAGEGPQCAAWRREGSMPSWCTPPGSGNGLGEEEGGTGHGCESSSGFDGPRFGSYFALSGASGSGWSGRAVPWWLCVGGGDRPGRRPWPPVVLVCVYTRHILSACSSVDGHLGRFRLLATVNGAAVTVGVIHIPSRSCSLLGKYPEVDLQDHRVVLF